MNLTPLIERAIVKAAELHLHQKRNNGAPYIVHPYAVAWLVSAYSKKDEVIVAALFHDVLEDTHYTYSQLKKDFGQKIADLVNNLTEEAWIRKRITPKFSWQSRKQGYINRLKTASQETVLISLADKYHNLLSFKELKNYRSTAFWAKFHSSKQQQLWFYGEALKIYQSRLKLPLVKEYGQVFHQVEKIFNGKRTKN